MGFIAVLLRHYYYFCNVSEVLNDIRKKLDKISDIFKTLKVRNDIMRSISGGFLILSLSVFFHPLACCCGVFPKIILSLMYYCFSLGAFLSQFRDSESSSIQNPRSTIYIV